MKKFRITIPEKRVEVVEVVYEVEAKDQSEIDSIIDEIREGNSCDTWEYVETKDSRWGFEVEDIFYEEMKVEEIK